MMIFHLTSFSVGSGSNLDSDSDNDEEDIKDEGMDTDTESHIESMPLKLTKSPNSLTDPSTGKISSSGSPNLQIHKPAKILQTMNRSWALTYHSTPSSSHVATPPGNKIHSKQPSLNSP